MVIVNPGGTGKPRFVISARLAPLPPSRAFWLLSPSVNSYTYLVIDRLLGWVRVWAALTGGVRESVKPEQRTFAVHPRFRAARVEQLTKTTGDTILLTQQTVDAMAARPDRLVDRESHEL